MRFVATVFRALWQGFDRLSVYIERYFTLAGVIILIGMWSLLMLSTVSRWISGLRVGWSLEIVAFMIAWSIFVMIAPVAKLDQHVKVTFLPLKLLGENRGLAFIRMVENMAGMALFIFMSIHAYRWVLDAYRLDMVIESMGGWDYPEWIVRSGILIGFTTTAFVYFQRMVKDMARLISGIRADRPGEPSELLVGDLEVTNK